MAEEKKDELEALLEEMDLSAEDVSSPKSEDESEEEIIEVDYEEVPPKREDSATSTLNKQKSKLTKSKPKKSNIADVYAGASKPVRDKFEKRLRTYDSKEERDKEVGNVPTRVEKITPDIEKVLFPHFVAGASVNSLHTQYGKQFGFGLKALYDAAKFYMWKERRHAIQKTVMTEQGVELADRMNDYVSFFDELMSEAMIRFRRNSDGGKNDNPFNHLKVQNVKDMKDLTELMMNIMGMKEQRRKEQEAASGESKNLKISDKKAAKLLEILANDDDGDEDETE